MCSRSSCINDFVAGRKCAHGFKKCNLCNELWLCDENTDDKCPRHPSQGESLPDMGEYEKRALSTLCPYNSDDTECDEVCQHAFDALKFHFCRHGMVSCDRCGHIWDGCAQCTCFMFYD